MTAEFHFFFLHFSSHFYYLFPRRKSIFKLCFYNSSDWLLKIFIDVKLNCALLHYMYSLKAHNFFIIQSFDPWVFLLGNLKRSRIGLGLLHSKQHEIFYSSIVLLGDKAHIFQDNLNWNAVEFSEFFLR